VSMPKTRARVGESPKACTATRTGGLAGRDGLRGPGWESDPCEGE
jgi:hypothetical protein